MSIDCRGLEPVDLGLKGRIALVTGGSRGIGPETATLLAQEGASVAVTYRSNRDAAETLVESIRGRRGRACALPLDLGSDESILRAIDTVIDDWGRIDVLVNNAVAFPVVRIREAFGVDIGVAALLLDDVDFTTLVDEVHKAMAERPLDPPDDR